MIKGKIKKWGGSFGLFIGKKDAEALDIKENHEVMVEITKKTDVLKELFGASKGKIRKNTEGILREIRRHESRLI